jgi:hypothetical protein
VVTVLVPDDEGNWVPASQRLTGGAHLAGFLPGAPFPRQSTVEV